MMSRKKNLNPKADVILRNEATQRVTESKFLDVIVDTHLNWKNHIRMVSHKINIKCSIISRIQNTFDIISKKMIYYILGHSYHTYCINVWSSTYRTNFKILYTAPKRSMCTLFLLLCSPIREISSIKKFCLWVTA